MLLSLFAFLFAEPLMALMNLPPELIMDATLFLRVVGGTSFIQAMTATMSAVARSHGMARLPMMMAFVMNLINLLCNWLVIYRPVPMPVSGVLGVALSQAFAAFCGFLLMAWLLTRKVGISLSLKDLIPIPVKEIQQILKVGLPTGIEFFSYSFAQMVSTYLSGGRRCAVRGLGKDAVGGEGMIKIFPACQSENSMYICNMPLPIFYVFLTADGTMLTGMSAL